MASALRLSFNSLRFSSSLPTSFSSSFSSLQLAAIPNENLIKRVSVTADLAAVPGGGCAVVRSLSPRKSSASFMVHAAATETNQPKWWEKNAGPNMIDIHSTQEFLGALSQAGDRLVVVEFYGTWCASCRALFPKLCRTAQEHPEVIFLKVNFDDNKAMCKNLNVKVLPYFHFYHGADGKVVAFSCSLAKFQKVKDAIQLHSTAFHGCNGNGNVDVNGRGKGTGDLKLEPITNDQSAESATT